MKKPRTTTGEKGATAGQRRRHAAISIGVAALLALGGVVWASGLGASRASDAQGAPTGTAAGTPTEVPKPDVTPSGAPEPVTAPSAPVPAEPSPAPAEPPPAKDPAPGEVEPAPVDRTGKSEEELAAIPQPVAAPVTFEAKKTVKGGVSATITEITAVQGEATGIGEVAGPALRFKVTVVNDTAAALSLEGALVDVSYGNDAEPATPLSGPDPAAFPSSVAPGSSGTGVFVFAVPPEARDKVTIHFNLEAETPIATFAGTAPA
jgi:hypothetical protein